MNTKHTPGPWTAKGRKMEARIYGNVDGGPVAVVPYVTEWASNQYDEANVKLIERSPDLLRALFDLVGAVGMDEQIRAKDQAIALLKDLNANLNTPNQ